MPNSIEDERLIKGCLKNDRASQFALYKKYAGQLMLVAARYANHQEDAEDILQEAFIKAYDKLDSYQSDSPIFHWLKKIVVNTALNKIRANYHMYPLVDDHQDKDQPSGMTNAIEHFYFEDLVKMIQSLPEGCRLVFNLYTIEGYTHVEIAKKLKISTGTSKSQLNRAKALLREMIRESERDSYEAYRQK
ncbi:MAG: sigma-70 family RNA polymerase sigma factor [Cyclobacteriaceae bacterium]|nr:sigma-70 family RNA polymerase sigma factor [Cyclobacteriaceae bacterium]MCH8516351.1 sigma-70 family RNA polymerase sigma factor [Cyclobacteriaceae bacterium]